MTGTTTRRADWQQRLTALVARRMAEPFAWGANDCCLWVADAVHAVTGRDPAAELRGTYRSARGAASVLRTIGGLRGAGARCGAPIAPLCAAAGDIGLVHDGRQDVLAVCTGEAWLATTATGLGAIELRAARAAWRVA